jgi:hypothetical protein
VRDVNRFTNIFIIVAVITTVSIRQRCEGSGGELLESGGKEVFQYLKMTVGLSSPGRNREVSGA